MKSLQKEQKAQIMEYKPQSAGINLQSPQSELTLWTLTLPKRDFDEKRLHWASVVRVSTLDSIPTLLKYCLELFLF